MASAFDKQVDEVIWALYCAKIPRVEIWRRLQENEAGLGKPLKIHRSNFYRRVQRLERDRKLVDVDNAPTDQALAAMARSVIEDEIKAIAKRQRRGMLRSEDARFLKMAQEMRATRNGTTSRGPASEPKGFLSTLAAEMNGEGLKDEVSSGHDTTTGEGLEGRARSSEKARTNSSVSGTPATSPTHA